MLFIVALLVAIGAFAAAAGVRRQQTKGSGGAAFVMTVVAVVFSAVAIGQWIRVIPAGNVGVVDLFGSVAPRALRAGIHLVNPFARVVNMTIKTLEIKETMDVPSKEGLAMVIEISVLFHLDPEQAPTVYRTVGEEYVPVILEPQFRSVTRGVTASYESKALYTSEREQLAHLITADLQKLVEPRGIMIESTPLRKLTLPDRLAGAIEEKLQAEQESQRMEFVLLKESQEADRKRIEAAGIADFQRIIASGLNDEVLRWKGIEATLEMARSPNAKVVVIGAGKEGMPLILGNN
ncbi:MAG: prohibitin family protein [Candidatus Eisenbacteria bacterium]|nr:prohibitin family protein [Candidatus Eisenbacteria bacterium]MCC7143434.1 prohibitin family protein [Candidatus Eisenbacteria bacterium]